MSAIKFSVFQTTLQGEAKFLGRVLLQGVYDRDAIVGRMLSMGTTLTRTDITAVVQLLATAVEQVCSEGYKVNLDGLVQVTPAIGGTFEGRNDGFEPGRNSVYLTAQVSKTLNARLSRTVAVERVVIDAPRPVLAQVTDSETGLGSLSAGTIVAITGKRLKFSPDRSGEYLRLVNAQNPNDFVPVTKFHQVSDQHLVFRLPGTVFTDAYFEMASSLKTSSLRVGRSPTFTIALP
jgi:hypothetical protein